MNLKRIKAFTLGELLTTLMIIGVIAALTIPSINQNTNNSELATGCLKAYSIISQGINLMKESYGPVGFGTKWNSSDILWKGKSGNYKEGFVAQFNTVKVDGSSTAKCYDEEMKYLNGSTASSTTGYTMITTDGMCINYATGGCDNKGIADGNPSPSDKHLTNCMGRFLVDVNGEKGPNVIGRDIYFFLLIKGVGVLPAGTDNNSASCKKNSTGADCAAKVINYKKIDIK